MVEYLYTVKKGKHNMMKFEKAANVGDVIRGYDFKPMAGRNDCYVEGKVIAITSEMGYKAFKVKCTKDVFDGKEQDRGEYSRVDQTVFIPMETSFMEFDARIINLSK
jgi:hypothetical protein